MESRVVCTVDFKNSDVLSCRKNPPETTKYLSYYEAFIEIIDDFCLLRNKK